MMQKKEKLDVLDESTLDGAVRALKGFHSRLHGRGGLSPQIGGCNELTTFTHVFIIIVAHILLLPAH